MGLSQDLSSLWSLYPIDISFRLFSKDRYAMKCFMANQVMSLVLPSIATWAQPYDQRNTRNVPSNGVKRAATNKSSMTWGPSQEMPPILSFYPIDTSSRLLSRDGYMPWNASQAKQVLSFGLLRSIGASCPERGEKLAKGAMPKSVISRKIKARQTFGPRVARQQFNYW